MPLGLLVTCMCVCEGGTQETTRSRVCTVVDCGYNSSLSLSLSLSRSLSLSLSLSHTHTHTHTHSVTHTCKACRFFFLNQSLHTCNYGFRRVVCFQIKTTMTTSCLSDNLFIYLFMLLEDIFISLGDFTSLYKV